MNTKDYGGLNLVLWTLVMTVAIVVAHFFFGGIAMILFVVTNIAVFLQYAIPEHLEYLKKEREKLVC